MTFYLKNTSGSTVAVSDLGLYLPDGNSLVIDSNAINGYLTTDLATAINAPTLILSTTDIGNSGGDMPPADAIKALTITSEYDTDNPHDVTITQTIASDANTNITTVELEELTDGSETALHIHDSRYYTEVELGASNTATVEVHWDNITNAPQFGSLEWKEPALGNLTGMGATGSEPASPGTGDFFLNTTDDHLYQYDGGSWVDQGVPTIGDRVIFKDGVGSDDKIYEWDGTVWLSDPIPLDNWAIIVSDDGDGGAAQYVYDTSGLPPDWIKIADVDWGSHTALADRTSTDSHPATAVSYNPSTSGLDAINVQTAIDELATENGVEINNIVYVAKNGVDVNANVTLGSIANPYLTIQAAHNSISTSSSTDRFVIYVMPGTYTENVTLSTDWVYIVGADRQACKITSASGDTITLSNVSNGSTGIAFMTVNTTSATTTDNAIKITGFNPRIFGIDFQAGSGARTTYITGAYEQTIKHSWFVNGEFRVDAGVVEFADSKVINALTNITAGELNIFDSELSNTVSDAISQSGGVVKLINTKLTSEASSLDYNQSAGTVYWGWVEYDEAKATFSGTKTLIFPSGDLIYDPSGSTLVATNVQAALDEVDGDITTIEGNITTHEGDTLNPHTVTFTQAVTADAGTDITVIEAELLTDGSNADTLHAHAATNITFNNIASGLTANDVQAALDELSSETGVSFTDTIFVAKNGNDTTGDGSMDNPFLTVQKGMDVASALGTYAVVFVYPGTYAENLTLQPDVCIYAFGKEPTRIGTNAGAHTLTFPASGRVFYKGVNFRLDAFNITHTPLAGGSISVWFEDCAVGAVTMNGLGWNDYLQFRGSMFVYEKTTIHAAQFTWFNGESQITLGSGDVQIEIDATGVEVAGPGGEAGLIALRDVEIANKLLMTGAITGWLYNTGIYNTITADGADAILNVDNSSSPAARTDLILLNGATMNLLDDAYVVGYDDTGRTNITADNVQDAITDLDSAITAFTMPSGTVFPVAPAPTGGDLFYRTDLSISYQYDSSRTEWLSITEMFLDWGAKAGDGNYMNIHGATATQTGYLMPRAGTIIAITAKVASGNQTKALEIRRNNDAVSPLFSYALSAGSYTVTTANVDFEAGDYIQSFVSSVGIGSRDIVTMAVVKWRG